MSFTIRKGEEALTFGKSGKPSDLNRKRSASTSDVFGKPGTPTKVPKHASMCEKLPGELSNRPKQSLISNIAKVDHSESSSLSMSYTDCQPDVMCGSRNENGTGAEETKSNYNVLVTPAQSELNKVDSIDKKSSVADVISKELNSVKQMFEKKPRDNISTTTLQGKVGTSVLKFLAHLIKQPYTIMLSVVRCRWHRHWHHLCTPSLATGLDMETSFCSVSNLP